MVTSSSKGASQFAQPTPKSAPKLLQATSKAQVTKIGGTAHRAELLRQNPGGEASSSISRPVIDLTQETFPVIGNISTLDLVDGLLHQECPFELETRVLLQRLSCISRSRPASGLKVIHLITEDFENLQKLCIPGQGR